MKALHVVRAVVGSTDMVEMDDGDREGQKTSGEDENEDADRINGTDDDRYKVTDTLEHSQFQQLKIKM